MTPIAIDPTLHALLAVAHDNKEEAKKLKLAACEVLDSSTSSQDAGYLDKKVHDLSGATRCLEKVIAEIAKRTPFYPDAEETHKISSLIKKTKTSLEFSSQAVELLCSGK